MRSERRRRPDILLLFRRSCLLSPVLAWAPHGSTSVPTALQCPAHSQFTSCLPSCPPSCSNLDGSCVESNFQAPATCKEGCLCQPGYLLKGSKCVLRVQCGCKGDQGLIPVSGCGGRDRWGWEVAHWVNCSPCKCEDLSSNLQKPM